MNEFLQKNKQWVAIVVALILGFYSLIANFRQAQVASHFTTMTESFLESQSKQTIEEIVDQGTNPKEKVLVIPIKGTIMGGNFSYLDDESYDHQLILDTIKKVEEDSSIQAILLDVDSPGGAVYHAAEVHQRLVELKEATDLPIYTSMGSQAASGGYYIPMASDKIFAAKDTITGSIGVITQHIDTSELMDKIGVKQTNITSGNNKDLGAMNRPLSDEDRKFFEDLIGVFYEEFINVIEEGRPNLSRDDIYKLADGRVFLGSEALDNGLIDEIGYFDEALAALIEDQGLEDPQIVHYQRKSKSALDRLISSPFLQQLSQQLPKSDLQVLQDELRAAQSGGDFQYLYLGGH